MIEFAPKPLYTQHFQVFYRKIGPIFKPLREKRILEVCVGFYLSLKIGGKEIETIGKLSNSVEKI